MPDIFDVSKEIILIPGASQRLGRQFARVSGFVPFIRAPCSLIASEAAQSIEGLAGLDCFVAYATRNDSYTGP
jgi:hypothetical protein